MIDYSFLRLEKDFAKAKDIGNPNVSNIINTNQIHLKPNEFYCQITNTSYGLTLAGDYEVYLIDECGNEIDDITEQLAVYEFSDIKGINQIAFEFYLTKDYGYTPLHLKIVHPYSEFTYYSNPFICTETNIEQTSYFVYRDYGYFNGISYDKYENYQAIRLNLWFDNVESQTEVSEYYQISTKNTIASRALFKQVYQYKSDYMNAFVFERINMMSIHDVIYIDGVRITNKPQLSSEERIGDTNYFTTSTSFFKDYSDTYTYRYNIFDDIELLNMLPFGNYENSSHPTGIYMLFNKEITNYDNIVLKLFKYDDDSFVREYTALNFTHSGNELTADLGEIEDSTKYYFTLNNGITSFVFTFEGINDKDTWWFRTMGGDYDPDDYDDLDYNTDDI